MPCQGSYELSFSCFCDCKKWSCYSSCQTSAMKRCSPAITIQTCKNGLEPFKCLWLWLENLVTVQEVKDESVSPFFNQALLHKRHERSTSIHGFISYDFFFLLLRYFAQPFDLNYMNRKRQSLTNQLETHKRRKEKGL